MSTGTEVIQDALRMIGAHNTLSEAEAETILLGMTTLNSMLQRWTSQNIDIMTTPLEVPGDELSEPADTRNAIVENLALLLSPNFDNGKNIVSPILKSNADFDYNIVKALYWCGTIPDKVVSATLPKGAGNSKGILREAFFGVGTTVNDSGDI